MLHVTPNAGARISRTLDANRQTDTDVFRVQRTGQDVAITMGSEQDGDVVVRHDGRAILVLDQAVVDALGDITIDTDGDAGQLALRCAADLASTAPEAATEGP